MRIPTASFYRPTYRACILIFLTSLLPAWSNEFRAGSEAARHHLQYLADTGAINLPLSSWPLPKQDVEAALEQVAPGQLDNAAFRSYSYLKNALNRSTWALEAQAGSSLPAPGGFSTDTREKNLARASIEGESLRTSGRLSLAFSPSPSDGKQFRLDGSQVALRLHNWNLGAGWVDRWWGPGWQSSLILSHNARPSPGVFIQRRSSQPFTLPILKSLGPWRLDAFANQLESKRAIPRAKLLGARFSFKPRPSLEIGLSRTAQWGGSGRPENFDTFFDLLIGNDNRGDDGINADASNEPGNQLGGIDWRYAFKVFNHSLACYGQFIGEDEANSLPSREIGMLGLEMPLISENFHGRVFLEFSDTTMRFLDNGIANSAYEHSIYRSGYRYYGRSIGASSDNDSRTLSLGGSIGLARNRYFNWQVSQATFNWDGAAGGNQVALKRIETRLAQLEYQFPLSENSSLALGGQLIGEELGEDASVRKSGAYARMRFGF